MGRHLSDQNQGRVRGLPPPGRLGGAERPASPRGEPLAQGPQLHMESRTLGLRDRHTHFTQNTHADITWHRFVAVYVWHEIGQKVNFFSTQPFLRRAVRITG